MADDASILTTMSFDLGPTGRVLREAREVVGFRTAAMAVTFGRER